MTAHPSISVVIPCYNADRYVEATLRSVLAQQGVTLEIIVVDDGSRDASVEVVRKGFPQVKVISQSNQGVAAARNTGIAAAAHDWVAFVDADDIWLPHKLATQWAMLQSNPQARVACTAWQVWQSTDPEPSATFLTELKAVANDAARWAGPSGWIYPELLLDCVVWTSTVLAQRTLLEELSGFDPTRPIGEDYDLWLRMSQLTPFVRVPMPMALYRLHAASTTRRVPGQNHQGLVITNALNRWGCLSPDGRKADRRAVERALAKTWLDFASARLSTGDFALARGSALRAVRLRPADPVAWKVLARAVLGAE